MSVPCAPHDVRESGSSESTARVPGGAIGYAFQSYLCPFNWWYTDFVGSMCEVRSMLSVITACTAIWFPKLNWPLAIGGSEPTDEVVLESLDGAFRGIYAMVGWLNYCHWHPAFLRYALMGFVAWLSVTLNFGLYPFSVSSVNISSNALIMVSSFTSGIGIANM